VLARPAGWLTGDCSVSAVFDNSKIKRFVPDYTATTTFAQGIRKSIQWFDGDPARQQVDMETVAIWDKIIAGYEKGLNDTVRTFA